jgi:hypothetical protein
MTTLADLIYYVGASRQASYFSIITDYIINHIRQTFDYSNDVANALNSRTTIDFGMLMPDLQESIEIDQDIRDRQNKQFSVLYEAEIKLFVE